MSGLLENKEETLVWDLVFRLVGTGNIDCLGKSNKGVLNNKLKTNQKDFVKVLYE